MPDCDPDCEYVANRRLSITRTEVAVARRYLQGPWSRAALVLEPSAASSLARSYRWRSIFVASSFRKSLVSPG
jgi:hypothetical protein